MTSVSLALAPNHGAALAADLGLRGHDLERVAALRLDEGAAALERGGEEKRVGEAQGRARAEGERHPGQLEPRHGVGAGAQGLADLQRAALDRRLPGRALLRELDPALHEAQAGERERAPAAVAAGRGGEERDEQRATGQALPPRRWTHRSPPLRGARPAGGGACPAARGPRCFSWRSFREP